jgi:predicted small lipoprotein YifL
MKQRLLATLACLLLIAVLTACGQIAPPADPVATDIPTEVAIVNEEKAEATSTQQPADALPPVDVTFEVNCSAIDPSRQPDCDAFISQTANFAYRHLRQLTGATLADCYKVVTYTIIPDDPSQLAGGYTTANAITYMEAYSVDSIIPYDVHELIHSFSWCTGSLDFHIFHGALMNAVFFNLGVPQFSQYPTEAGTREELDRLREALQPVALEDRFDLCTGVLADLIIIAHFQFGDEILTRMYQSTINAAPLSSPSDIASVAFRATAPQAQAVVEIIEAAMGPVDVPECGL